MPEPICTIWELLVRSYHCLSKGITLLHSVSDLIDVVLDFDAHGKVVTCHQNSNFVESILIENTSSIESGPPKCLDNI
jgi:hypothetical protein